MVTWLLENRLELRTPEAITSAITQAACYGDVIFVTWILSKATAADVVKALEKAIENNQRNVAKQLIARFKLTHLSQARLLALMMDQFALVEWILEYQSAL